ncbi:hypothetical protein Desmer_1556 [Desulfosporosinus meridiei DSM 13257]|uniref:Uncharacterized protein n=1 Tax=Desulfosporosinus meridiei (strain ATCC BAA-275 / DSM 13257 / KCTC 12902 / NCIMB 13706 / S10) TaxID=768704 RepID=J7INX0_DESMD|nr:hypothetical protein Desmer_1556 [Desulfosporosinus meridiei DSM 13257]
MFRVVKRGVEMVWVWFMFLVIVLNIPFGYWRENVKRLSCQWFFAVHFPVLVMAFFRIHLGIGWGLSTVLLIGSAYFSGQWLGAKWNRTWKRSMNVSNCLLRDIALSRWIIIYSAKKL